MAYFFDIEKAKMESGLTNETIKKISEEAKAEFPNDEMMFELHVLRAIDSLTHPLPVREKIASAKPL